MSLKLQWILCPSVFPALESRVTIGERSRVSGVCPLPSAKERGSEGALASREVFMINAYISIAALVLVCAGLYSIYARRRAFISTTEWVKLMRENDLRFDRAARSRAVGSRSSQAL
jgi:hypothetical protein